MHLTRCVLTQKGIAGLRMDFKVNDEKGKHELERREREHYFSEKNNNKFISLWPASFGIKYASLRPLRVPAIINPCL